MSMKTYRIATSGVLRRSPQEVRLSLHYTILQGLYWFGICAVNGFVSYYLSEKGFTDKQIGMIIAAVNTILLISQPFVAQFADKAIKIRIKHIILLFMSISMLLAGAMFYFSPKSNLFMPTYLILLVLTSLSAGLLTTLSSEHIARGTRINYSIARGIGSISFASMSIIAGLLTKRMGPNVSMLLFILFVTLFILALIRFPSSEKTIKRSDATATLSLKGFVLTHKRFMLTVFATFLMFISNNMVSTYFFQIVENVGGDASSFGKAVAIAAYIELISMMLYPLIKKRFGSHAMIMKLSSIAIFLKSIFILHAVSVGSIYLAQTLQFFGFGFYIPAQVYYVSSVIPEKDIAKGQMFIGFAGTLAVVFSSMVGGHFFDKIGMYQTIMIGAGLSFIGIVMMFFCMEKDKYTDLD